MMAGTMVLIPVAVGSLVELFVTEQVAEDEQLINFIISGCNLMMGQERSTIAPMNIETQEQIDCQDPFMSSFSPPGDAFSNVSVPHDISVDRIRRQGSSRFRFMECVQGNIYKEQGRNDIGRSDSFSDCSDHVDDEDDGRCRRSRKGPQAKNLFAERRRRKKLNDRILALRTLVPNISKLDKASVLVDAIEFVKELQNQATKLQNELEKNSDDENGKKSNAHQESLNQNDQNQDPNCELLSAIGSNRDFEIGHDQMGQQMEVQVEVAEMNGNDHFFIKVFCEHQPGGFARLVEALHSLGFEITSVNVASSRGLVSNILTVEKKHEKVIQVDFLKGYLLELSKNTRKEGVDVNKFSENSNRRRTATTITTT